MSNWIVQRRWLDWAAGVAVAAVWRACRATDVVQVSADRSTVYTAIGQIGLALLAFLITPVTLSLALAESERLGRLIGRHRAQLRRGVMHAAAVAGLLVSATPVALAFDGGSGPGNRLVRFATPAVIATAVFAFARLFSLLNALLVLKEADDRPDAEELLPKIRAVENG